MEPIKVGTHFVIPEVEVCFLDGAEARFHDPQSLGQALTAAYDTPRPDEQQPSNLFRCGYQRVVLRIQPAGHDEQILLKYELGVFQREWLKTGGVPVEGLETRLWIRHDWLQLPERRIAWPGHDGGELGRFFWNQSEEPSMIMVDHGQTGLHPLYRHQKFVGLTLQLSDGLVASGSFSLLDSSAPGDTYRTLGELDGLFDGRDDQVGNWE